jgi:hypothetical protein
MSGKRIRRKTTTERLDMLEERFKAWTENVQKAHDELRSEIEKHLGLLAISLNQSVQMNRAAQQEVDALFYLLNKFRKRRFSFEKLEQKVQEVAQADQVGGHIAMFLRWGSLDSIAPAKADAEELASTG